MFIDHIVQFEYLRDDRIRSVRHDVSEHGILQFNDLNREIVSFAGFYRLRELIWLG